MPNILRFPNSEKDDLNVYKDYLTALSFLDPTDNETQNRRTAVVFLHASGQTLLKRQENRIHIKVFRTAPWLPQCKMRETSGFKNGGSTLCLKSGLAEDDLFPQKRR